MTLNLQTSRVDVRATRRAMREKISLLCSTLLFSAWVQGQPVYDALLERARAGDYAPALSFLRAKQSSWQSPRYLTDHLLIAGWAGEDAEVAALYEQHASALALSGDALAGVARAYRNLRQWPAALTVYRQGLVRFAEHQGLLLGQVMTLADAGQMGDAIAQGRALVAQAPNDAERRLALAYAFLRDGQRYAALFEVGRARELAPEHIDVAREYLLSLQRAGMPQQALALAQGYPGLLEPAQVRQLQGDILAAQVRMAGMATRRENERFQIADRALADAEELLQAWAGQPEAHLDIIRVRIDRLGAFHARVRMTDVLTQYQQLQVESVSLPDYALRWVASASLYLRQPEQAAELYRQVLSVENDKHPEWLEDQRGLFYALVESEQLEVAQQKAEQLASSQPSRIYMLGNPEPEPNVRWLEAQELLFNAALQVNDTPGAEQAIAHLAENAPNNSGLRTARAGLYLARGWPRRAEDELKVAESGAPRNLALEVEQGLAALELQEWRQLDLLADDVIQRYPESLQAQRLQRLRQVHHMAELRVSGYRGLGSGSSVSGGNDLGIDTAVYTVPLHDDWRIFAGSGYATGDFEEGRGQHRWLRTGVEWRLRNHTLEAELSRHDFGHGNPLGLRLGGSHDVDDHWQYGWSAQHLAVDTPLRALNADISSDSASGYLRWRGDERREWSLSVNGMHFSDGNNRLALLLDGSQRFFTAPTWQADFGLELGASRNSGSAEVPYFNPEAEFSVLPSVKLSHTLYRRYQTIWSQQAELGVGGNSQRNYGTATIGVISYGQRLRFDDRFDGGLAISASSRPYDGEREHEVQVLFDINYRF